MNRIFISYRSSDGRQSADRLAQDLSRLFGAHQVFHDQHDLSRDGSWHDEIMRSIGKQPIVLAVVTPDFFGARTPGGHVCIEELDDPVRQELEIALLTRATVIPLLTDDATMPRAGLLPSSLHAFTERHALHLRTATWSEDLACLSADLQGLGVSLAPPRPEVQSSGFSSKPLVGMLLASFSLLALLVFLNKEVTPDRPVATAPTTAQVLAQRDRKLDDVMEPTAAGQASLSGAWLAVLADGSTLPFTVSQDGKRVSMSSERLTIDATPQAQNLAAWALPHPDKRIKDLHFRAEGTLDGQTLQMTMVLETGNGQRVIDEGALELLLSEDERGMAGGVHFSKNQPGDITFLRQ
jgi:hypothetical protein